MSDGQNLARDYADALAASLADDMARLELAGRYAHSSTRAQEDHERLTEELNDRPLEIVARVGSPYSIVLTVGGPHAEITWDGAYGTRNAVLRVAWGSGDAVTRSNDGIREVAAYFLEMMRPEEMY